MDQPRHHSTVDALCVRIGLSGEPVLVANGAPGVLPQRSSRQPFGVQARAMLVTRTICAKPPKIATTR
jgi:hypothetical protein